MGAPVELGPSPVARQYSRRSDLTIPPAQWGNRPAREEGAEECELFGEPPHVEGDPLYDLLEQEPGMKHQDELQIAVVTDSSNAHESSPTSARCVNGQIVRAGYPARKLSVWAIFCS